VLAGFIRPAKALEGTAESLMRAPKRTIENARRFRRSMSPPEALLWRKLRLRATGFPAFRRQHPIGQYVLDFYCAKARLAIEVDGSSHDAGDRPQRDEQRDTWLKAQGVTVIRIPAAHVMHNVDEIADGCVRMAESLVAGNDLIAAP
jgi:very-short-patch-repair endonuclease